MTHEFYGSMPALVTPFSQGAVDIEALTQLVEWHCQSGTHALVPCGTTGEASSLSDEEYATVIKTVVKTSQGRLKVLAGAGSNITEHAIDLSQIAKESGANGLLHITPYYNKPTQAGLKAHFEAIARATHLPVVLYNVPGRTSVSMSLDTILDLAHVPNIVGIKEASGNMNFGCELLLKRPATFGFYSGEDALNLPFYLMGADGAISVTANVIPSFCAQIYNLAKAGKTEEALRLHKKIFDFHGAMFCETNPMPVKFALSHLKKIKCEYRLPMLSPTTASQKNIIDCLERILSEEV